MTVNRINGTLFTGLSALDGRTLSTLTAVNGQTIVGGYTPSNDSNIWMWGEPWREVGLSDTNPMDQLTDQTGNGRHWTQSGSPRPLYQTNEINGLAVSDHNGVSSHYWNGPDLSSLTAAHVFIIAKLSGTDPNASSTFTGLWRLDNQTPGTSTASHWPWTDGVIYDSAFSSTRRTVGNPTPSLTSWRIYEVISTSSEWTAKLDYTQLFTTGTNTVSMGTTPTLGRSSGSLGNYVFPGLMAGFYIFSAKKTGTDLTNFQSYITSTFAIP